MPIYRTSPNRSKRTWYKPSFALFLWICLWCNLNTGFWNLHAPNNFSELVDCIRGSLIFFVLALSAFLLLRRKQLHFPRGAPSRLLLAYGIITTIAAVFSPVPSWALYWSVAFLATVLCSWTSVNYPYPLNRARLLLVSTWIGTFIVAAIIGYRVRGAVFNDASSGYGVMSDLHGLTRSSGVARWAAVPGLVCLIRAYHTRRLSLFAFFFGVSAVSFYIVYKMQSRGAVFGSAAAFVFALLISSRMRRYALPFAAVAMVSIVIIESPETLSNHVTKYLERGQTREEFLTMTGRTRAYNHGIAAIEEAPLLGRGQWADRLLIREHVHNSFLQALLNGGLFGGIPYFASWITGWWIFYKLQKNSDRFLPEDRLHILECGTVMMFFTVRAIPETTTASYAVDLLIMVAVYVYLEVLMLRLKYRPPLLVAQPYHVATIPIMHSYAPAQTKVQSPIR